MISLPTVGVPTYRGKLLAPGRSNFKLAKYQGPEYLPYGLSLSPYKTSGYNLCPKSSPGCRATCLMYSGMASIFPHINERRIEKAKFFMEDRAAFLRKLMEELHNARKLAIRKGKKLAVRLNVLQDIKFESVAPEIFQEFNDGSIFYDYTKIPKRLGKTPPNYFLLLSRSELNWADCVEALNNGFNVAVVFGITPMQYKKYGFPKKYMGYKTISGEEHDLRFLDAKAKPGKPGNIVSLVAKGLARKDTSGFVVRDF